MMNDETKIMIGELALSQATPQIGGMVGAVWLMQLRDIRSLPQTFDCPFIEWDRDQDQDQDQEPDEIA